MNFQLIKKTNKTATVHGTLISDRRLSLQAKGLFLFLAFLKDGKDFNLSTIEAFNKDKETSIKNSMRELFEHGYLNWDAQTNKLTINDNPLLDDLVKRVLTKNKPKKEKTPVKQKQFPQEVIDTTKTCMTFFDEHLLFEQNLGWNMGANWLDTVDKLHRIDGIPYEEIIRITKLAREDRFWSKNFLSLTKLRKKKDGIKYIVIFSEAFRDRKKEQKAETFKENLKGW